jgi:hypothetical protein
MQLLQILVPIILMLLPIIVVVLQTIGMIMEMMLPIIVPILEVIGQVLQAVLPIIYTIIASVYNAIVTLYNWFAKNDEDYMDTKLEVKTTSAFEMPKLESNINLPAYTDPVANSYAGGNNVSSIKNDTKNITVDASFNSNISGEASRYSQEIQKSNYTSASLLASIIEEGA